MLSAETKAKAEGQLKSVDEEIATLTAAGWAGDKLGALYLEHLRAHKAMWEKFLKAKPD